MFKTRKNRTFNYTSRYSNNGSDSSKSDKTEGNPSTTGLYKGKRNRKSSALPILLIILAGLIALLYYLDLKLK